MAISKTQVISLLGQGLSSEVVASAVGCSPGYISQLLSDEEVAAEVASLRAKTLTAATDRDKSIDAIEDSLISKLAEVIDGGQVYKPGDILKCFAVINAAKRRGVSGEAGARAPVSVVVNLNIPETVQRNFVMASSGEVIEAGGKSLLTLPTHQLLNQLGDAANESSDHGTTQAFKELAAKLPGASVRISEAGAELLQLSQRQG